MKVLHVVGARPNFPKLAPVYRALRERSARQLVVHTGQHYDESMSGGFIEILGLPLPDVNLGVGSDSHARQTASIMLGLEPVFLRERPDWIVVYGDVNSTLAASLVASKLGMKVAHVEAGLRSSDRRMPEEINRLVTDRLSNLLLTHSRAAGSTLLSEGVPPEQIVFVGNVMIDSLLTMLPKARDTGFAASLGLTNEHVTVTLHRPSNVDDVDRLSSIIQALRKIARARTVVFPVHPRTSKQFRTHGIDTGEIITLAPIGYLEMLDLVQSSHLVITDSGGLQEETTALSVPCITIRENTERPITITEGTNQLVPDPSMLAERVVSIPSGKHRLPEGWDGRAGERVAAALMSLA